MTVFDLFALLGGVGLFLYGMTIMSTGLKNAAGDNLRTILEHATTNRFVAVLVGIAVTILIQSSSATDVMVIGFVNSGLMSLAQAIGIIMGANIGTTITAQLTAFNLSQFAPLILFVGAVMYLFLKKNLVRYIGMVILGFGMLFEGIAIMKSAITPLSNTPTFIGFLSTLSNPILALLFGLAFTALVQSSSSSIVIFQAFAMQGILEYHIAVYLIMGAAVGSVTPNLLASLTANRKGKRTAILNLMFNIFRAIILMILIHIFPQILDGIQHLSPNDIGRQIANTHTIFAIIAVLIELPFASKIIALAERIIPVTQEEIGATADRKLVYMDNIRVSTIPPAVLLSDAKREICRMGEYSTKALRLSMECFFELDEKKVNEVLELEDTVDYLNRAITEGLVVYRSHNMTTRDIKRISMLTLVVSDLERISDHAKEFALYASQLGQQIAKISDDGMSDLRRFADIMQESVRLCLEIFETEQFDRVPEAERLCNIVDEMQVELTNNHIERLTTMNCDPTGGIIYTDMLTGMERCSAHAINVACALTDHPS
ncbi:MAG: Na/Pi cotransporter family protein [Eubacteriales bacterium]|nr:Na/Pi cotransporter family protein [Eubacteriales bacterium]